MSLSFFALQMTFSMLAFAGTFHSAWDMKFKKDFKKLKSPLSLSHDWLRKPSISILSSIGFVWAATCLAQSVAMPQRLSLLIWLVAVGNLVRVTLQTWKFQLNSPQEEPIEVQRRLLQLQHQLHKLHEKEALDAQLEKTNQSQEMLDRYGAHFKRVLMTIENHLIYGENEHAERVITLFSRHLRQLLHEGSTPFLSLENSIEHIKTHLELMAVLTGHRFVCDVDDDMLDANTLKRCTERFQLSPWVEERVWPFFSLAERSLNALHPMTLVIDIESNRVILTFSGHDLHQGRAIPQAQFRLLGDPSLTAIEQAYSESMLAT
jgi:hypothetical protein